MQNQNNQNISVPTGATLEKVPYSQINSIGVDPTPGFICVFVFFLLLIILYKKCEYHYLNWFEHKKEMDKLELDLKYGKGNRI